MALGAGAVLASRGNAVPQLEATPQFVPNVADRTSDAAAALVPITYRNGEYTLRGNVFKPEGRGPFPTLIYNHGSERDPSLEFAGDLGKWFQSRGFVVFFPYRRGSAGSEGPYWEDELSRRPESEVERARVELMDAENADVVAAVSWVRQQRYVDSDRLFMAGCSYGGIQTVLSAEKDIGIRAAVDFAGASITWQQSVVLQDRLKAAVRRSTVPVFFLQAANDFDTTPSRVLDEEMELAGKPHQIHIFPRFGKSKMEGHARFCNHGMDVWGQEVLAFLKGSPK
ncbi:prolyl oligopeptidase family serine peptidase [Pendulispora brunnea]|uniref:Prolyl oligopeptidase family serine peptidase n=1 Tax=Pendulispora brunnea TaxID=2905690 RepID=A0ABZ2KM81_9BACT